MSKKTPTRPAPSQSLFHIVLIISAIGENIVEYQELRHVRYAMKPLVMVLIILGYIAGLEKVQSTFKNWIIAALLLSLGGDVALMLDHLGEAYFLSGVGFFMVAHICYIIAFTTNMRAPWTNRCLSSTELRNYILFCALPLGIVYAYTFKLFGNKFGDLTVPVFIYISVLVIMGAVASLRIFYTTKKSFYMIMVGVVVFMISDSLIGLKMAFKLTQRWIPCVLMGTYYLAQYLISNGSKVHILNQEVATKDKAKKQ